MGEKKLIQVCWDISDEKTRNREIRGLKGAMMGEFSINSGTIVTWDEEALFEDNIHAVPIWKWLLDEHMDMT